MLQIPLELLRDTFKLMMKSLIPSADVQQGAILIYASLLILAHVLNAVVALINAVTEQLSNSHDQRALDKLGVLLAKLVYLDQSFGEVELLIDLESEYNVVKIDPFLLLLP
jgi:hypothetical protein